MKLSPGKMLNVSTILNILVLIPVVTVILLDIPQVEAVWGENQPSRQILVSIYIAILIASIILWLFNGQPKFIVGITILSMQLIYKTLTAFLVEDALTNPVVLSNLAINLVHITTIITIFRHNPNLLTSDK